MLLPCLLGSAAASWLGGAPTPTPATAASTAAAARGRLPVANMPRNAVRATGPVPVGVAIDMAKDYDDLVAEENADEPAQSAPSQEDWMFFDSMRLYVGAGDGGNGCVAFKREKDKPKMGPGGGNGGRGGSVYLTCDEGLNMLKQGLTHYRATSGQNGQGKTRHGWSGEDIEVAVPPGTLVREQDTGTFLGEVMEHGQRLRVARGGRGGRGNAAFKTARDTTPGFAEKGEAGAERWLKLELKLVADVGLVGCPNAGKSTLLAASTRAKPKIADYPFTTVVPNLGVWHDAGGAAAGDGLVLADIPGLLEGAHEGKGLGRAFLRHTERCRILVHVVDGTSADPVGDLQAVNAELELFSPWLARKPQVVVLNKVDVPEVREQQKELLAALAAAAGHKRVLPISAATAEAVPTLLKRLCALNVEAKKRGNGADPEGAPAELAVDLDDEDAAERRCTVSPVEPGVWFLTGARIEKAAAMTNWDYYEAQARFQRVMQALGVSEQLKQAGAKNGDLVMVGDVDFKYFEETAMAARARLAGFYDDDEDADERDDAEWLRRKKRLDEELATLLDDDGEVLRF